MTKMKRGLDIDDDGQAIVYPVVGYTAFLAFGMTVGLRLEYVISLDPTEKPQALQVVLTPTQARELAQSVLKMADRAIQPPASGGAHN
ncbi:hypothetical protein LCGC14_1760640 [marine sediment metagenome]|uniref:Uncharacterized protein n=1 Tax=marine sediment metagenome TaxID=412755 RepID=A0A0F9JG97_9ZZZZ